MLIILKFLMFEKKKILEIINVNSTKTLPNKNDIGIKNIIKFKKLFLLR